jgi:hypothetical protein
LARPLIHAANSLKTLGRLRLEQADRHAAQNPGHRIKTWGLSVIINETWHKPRDSHAARSR